MDKSKFEDFSEQCFIKSSDLPNKAVVGPEKAKLNRKGNELFNGGDIEAARRIFQTTGYSDGLIRVGDRYLEGKRPVDALKMYFLAGDVKKKAELTARAALAIQKLLRQEEEENERPTGSGSNP